MTSLEQVFVDFEAVVTRISYNNVAIVGDSEALRAVQRIGWRVNKRQEWTFSIKHLQQTDEASSSSSDEFIN